MSEILQAPIFSIDRHRMGIDGQGVTTLVAFHGCTLRCRYCINSLCLRPDGIQRMITPQELLDEVKIDNLYYIATGGGITFGGGEPALRSEFIECFCKIAPSDWHINLETALNVERHHIERLLPYIDQYFIDIKDVNPKIYRRYTCANIKQVLDNLEWLLSNDSIAQRIIVRLPLIKLYNTPEDVRHSREYLESIGVKHFDEFEYQSIHTPCDGSLPIMGCPDLTWKPK